LKKSTIIKFFIWLLAIELIVMAVLIWPDLISRLFRSPGNFLVNTPETQINGLLASPTEWFTPTVQIIEPTRTQFIYTNSIPPTLTSSATPTFTPTPTRYPVASVRPFNSPTNQPIINPPTALPSSTPTYKPTYTRTPVPTYTPINPTDTEVPLTATAVPPTVEPSPSANPTG
jgi:hypothetical protein